MSEIGIDQIFLKKFELSSTVSISPFASIGISSGKIQIEEYWENNRDNPTFFQSIIDIT